MRRTRKNIVMAAFAVVIGVGVTLPATKVIADAAPFPDFCLFQCGPLYFPDPPEFPDYDCGGRCLTPICSCYPIGVRDNNNKLIGVDCACVPYPPIFGPPVGT